MQRDSSKELQLGQVMGIEGILVLSLTLRSVTSTVTIGSRKENSNRKTHHLLN